METATMEKKKINHGLNIKTGRTIRGIKQEYLSKKLKEKGFPYGSTKTITALENSETIDDEVLQAVSEIIEVDFNFLKFFSVPDNSSKTFLVSQTNRSSKDANSTYNNVGDVENLNVDSEAVAIQKEWIKKLEEKIKKLETENRSLFEENITLKLKQ